MDDEKNWKDWQDTQVDTPISLELNCSYLDFITWLKSYPEDKGIIGQRIRLEIKELRQLEITWLQELKQPGFDSIFIPLFDGFAFDVIQNNPLILSGFYCRLPIEPGKDIYTDRANAFLDLVNRYFGNPKKSELDPTDARILAIIQKEPKITDQEIAQSIGIGRQAVNTRRRALEKAGYAVR